MIVLVCGVLKWAYRWTYLQNTNSGTDVENNLMVTRCKGVGTNSPLGLGLTHTHNYI